MKAISIIDMPTLDWLKLRKEHICSSDGPGVMGLAPVVDGQISRTPSDVFYDKTLSKVIEKPDNEAMEFGRDFEDYVADHWAKRTGMKIQRDNKFRIHDVLDFIGVDLDRRILSNNGRGPGVLEIKTTSSWAFKTYWIDEETGLERVPDHVLIQLFHQMLVTGDEYGYVALFIADARKMKSFFVPRNNESIKLMVEVYSEFWYKHVVPKVPPPPMTISDIHRLFPVSEAGAGIDAKPDILEKAKSLYDARALKKAAERQEKEGKDALQFFMGGCENLTYQGATLATWKSDKKTLFDENSFKKKHPEIFEKFSRQITVLDESRLKEERPGLYKVFCKSKPGSRRFLFKDKIVKSFIEEEAKRDQIG